MPAKVVRSGTKTAEDVIVINGELVVQHNGADTVSVETRKSMRDDRKDAVVVCRVEGA